MEYVVTFYRNNKNRLINSIEVFNYNSDKDYTSFPSQGHNINYYRLLHKLILVKRGPNVPFSSQTV